MGLKEFKVLFDNPEKIYYPAETIKGRIVIAVDSSKRYRGIHFTIKGEAQTFWKENKSKKDSQGNTVAEEIKYSGHENYFSKTFYISVGNIELSPGTHAYPFEYNLPPVLPSSFESKLGYIRYTINGTIHRSWKFDHTFINVFRVISKYDLNTDPRAKIPVMVEKNKTFGCCCTSPPVTVNLTIPFRGYAPGQSIPVRVDIENESGIKIHDVKLTLQKYVIYRANIPHNKKNIEWFIVSRASKEINTAQGNFSYEQLLKVPALQPTTLNNNSIINLQYTVNLEACVEGWYRKNLRISSLILIGTEPVAIHHAPLIQNSQPSEPPSSQNSSGPLSEISLSASPDYSELENVFLNLAPPTYTEAMFESQNCGAQGGPDTIYTIRL